MRRPFFALLAIAALTLSAAACADWSEEDLNLFLEELAASYPIQEPGKPLSESSDEDVRAASASASAIDAERQAQKSLQNALESKDYRELDKAIEVRPGDATYLFHQAALLWAEQPQVVEKLGDSMRLVDPDDVAGLAIARAKGLIGGNEFESPEKYFPPLLDALLATMARYDEGSLPWKRLAFRYCASMLHYVDAVGPTVESLVYSSLLKCS